MTAQQRWEQWQRDLSTKADGWVHCDYGADDRPGNPTCTEAMWDLHLKITSLREALEAILEVHPELTEDGYPRGDVSYHAEIEEIASAALEEKS